MNYTDREDTMALLTDWQKHHAAVQKLMHGVEATIGIDPDGPMHTTVWSLFDAYTGVIAAEIGDCFEWMDWYMSETDMGKRGKAIPVNGKPRRIKTLAQLCAVIIDERKRIPA